LSFSYLQKVVDRPIEQSPECDAVVEPTHFRNSATDLAPRNAEPEIPENARNDGITSFAEAHPRSLSASLRGYWDRLRFLLKIL
jgi:hypothetical protein